MTVRTVRTVHTRRTGRGAALAMVCALAGCGGAGAGGGQGKGAQAPTSETRQAKDRPPLAVVARDGDPRGAIAVAVSTDGIAADRGAEAAVALAALVEARLESATRERGGANAMIDVTPAWDGYRARALVANEGEAAAVAERLRVALLAPVVATEVARVHKKLAALARRPMADAALVDAVRCTGEVFALPGVPVATPSAADIEGWRQAAHGLGRVVFATTGSERLADAVASSMAKGPAWPRAAAPASAAEGSATEPTEVYDATGDVPSGAARITLSVRAPSAEQAVAAAGNLGDPHGALASRLGGLEAPSRVRDVTATAHAAGGCLAVTIDFAPHDLAGDAAPRIAMAVALARQELALEVAEAPSDVALARALARRAGDPRESAEVAAWWTLATSRAGSAGDAAPRSVRIATAIGIAIGKDATPADTTIAARAKAIRAEIDRALVAWREPVVETRARVERGQGEMWLLLGSPCGTLAEIDTDAGLGAAFALAAADRAEEALRGTLAWAEGWTTTDGLGVIVHGPALPGEPPAAQARRLADAAARSFAAEPVDRASVARARGLLLASDDREESRALVAIAHAVAPGHPSWIAPMGPIEAIGRSSDASVLARAAAVRAGPLRVAVVASADVAQSEAAARAVDRWNARRPGAARACPVPTAPPPPHAGTYAVDVRAGAPSEAWLAVPLPPNDDAARLSATWIAAALDGPDGLLAHALGAGLARAWSARVVGSSRAPALIVRVASGLGALDAAVAQTRALLDRVRQGSLVEADRTRAASIRAQEELAAALDPRARLAALWRGDAPLAAPPTLDVLRAFASATLRDDALVIVVARPPRTTKPS
jgi:hypothetical protein